MLGRAAAGLAICSLLVACKREAGDAPAEPMVDADVAPDAAAAPPRRPTKRWYMGRTQERCEVYSVDGEVVSPPTPAPCPRYIEVGERIRIAGKTCMREDTRDPARAVPVVCPDPLTNAEKIDPDRPD
jgi:hypothetical protein